MKRSDGVDASSLVHFSSILCKTFQCLEGARLGGVVSGLSAELVLDIERGTAAMEEEL